MPPKRRRSMSLPSAAAAAAAAASACDASYAAVAAAAAVTPATSESQVLKLKSTLKRTQQCLGCGNHRPGSMLVLPACGHHLCMACINSCVAQQMMNLPKINSYLVPLRIKCFSCSMWTKLNLNDLKLTPPEAIENIVIHKLASVLTTEKEPTYHCPLAHLCGFPPQSSVVKFQEHVSKCCLSTFRCWRRNARGVSCGKRFSLLDEKTRNHSMECATYSCAECLALWHAAGSPAGDSLHWNKNWQIDVNLNNVRLHQQYSTHTLCMKHKTLEMQQKLEGLLKESHDKRSVDDHTLAASCKILNFVLSLLNGNASPQDLLKGLASMAKGLERHIALPGYMSEPAV